MFKGMNQLLLLNHPASPASWNMAVDQFLMEDDRPWLRFYQWEKPCLSLGYFQDSKEVNLSLSHQGRIDLVRRMTGGKAVLHQHELTYSLSLPVEWFPGELRNSYLRIGQALLEGLSVLGVEGKLLERQPEKMQQGNCFQQPGWFEVLHQDKKLIGSAQVRRKGRLLQHGSILLNRDIELIQETFSHQENEELSSTSIGEILGDLPPVEKIREAMKMGFQKEWNLTMKNEELRAKELDCIDRICKSRYDQDSWNLRR